MNGFEIHPMYVMSENNLNDQISVDEKKTKFIEDSIKIYIMDSEVNNFIYYHRIHSLNHLSKSFQKGFIIGIIYQMDLQGYKFQRCHIKKINKKILYYYISLRNLYDSQLVKKLLDQNFELFNLIQILFGIDTVGEQTIIVNQEVFLLGIFLSLLIYM